MIMDHDEPNAPPIPTAADPLNIASSQASQADLDTSKKSNDQRIGVDAQYRAYVSIYNSIDNLIWRNVSIMLTVTIITAGLIATFVPREEVIFGGLSHKASVGVGFLLVGLFYGISTFTFMRMKQHQEVMEHVLSQMEESQLIEGYFHKRVRIVQKWWMLDTTWNMLLFWMLGSLTMGAAVYYILERTNLAVAFGIFFFLFGAVYFSRNRNLQVDEGPP